MTKTLESSYFHHLYHKRAMPCNIIKSICFASITAKQDAYAIDKWSFQEHWFQAFKKQQSLLLIVLALPSC